MTAYWKSEYTSPLGTLHLLTDERAVRQVSFSPSVDADAEDGTGQPVMQQLKAELDAYFAGELRAFSVPLAMDDTAFRLRVWQQLRKIPYGQTISYQGLAIRLGDPKCIRAAGTANGKNPIAIIVPCHRVIGQQGSLVGYAGELWRKRWLLDHEARFAHGLRSLFD